MSFGGIEKISAFKALDFTTVQRILSSVNITDGQKAQFIKNNSAEIHGIMQTHLNSKDFSIMMKNRPLIKFRPLRNSFTKRGDKILLAKTLGIEPIEVDDYVEDVAEQLLLSTEISDLSQSIPTDNIEAIKTYVYRHGKKQQVLEFLDYELSNAVDVLKTLYRTFSYETGGLADYFTRPIHRMDNKTMASIYRIVDKHLDKMKRTGQITPEVHEDNARWALIRIYEIQNDQRLIKAARTYEALK